MDNIVTGKYLSPLAYASASTGMRIAEAFDAVFFAAKYKRRFAGRNLSDVQTAFEVYLNFVTEQHLDPNAAFSESSYLAEHSDIARAVKAGQIVSGFQHWIEYGRDEQRSSLPAAEDDNFYDEVEEKFDHEFFARKYKNRFKNRNLEDFATAISLYSSFVARDALDPNREFSEEYYRIHNPDVSEAIYHGVLSTGFEHWLKYGESEGRFKSQALSFDRCGNGIEGVFVPTPLAVDPSGRLYIGAHEYQAMLENLDPAFLCAHGKTDFGAGSDGKSAFVKYVSHLKDASADPRPDFSETHYLKTNADVAAAVRDHLFLSGFHHWVLSGRAEGRVCRPVLGAFLSTKPANELTLTEQEKFREMFQFSYYAKYYGVNRCLASNAFQHFIDHDLLEGVVPVDTNVFDEDFYVSYYGDVQEAKRFGRIPSGYYHYVLVGKDENRQPTHDLAVLLKAKLGDAAEPVGLSNVLTITDRLKPIPMRLAPPRQRVINIFVPALDGDIMFGGYIAFLHFLSRVAEQGHRLRFILREDPYGNHQWFLRGLKDRPRWLAAFKDQEFLNATKPVDEIEFSEFDLCISFSTWTMFDAWSVAQHLKVKKPIFFIQEYEPIFHENNSLSFVMSSSYDLPHLPIFNSAMLAEFFQQRRIGVFSGDGNGKSLSFEHALTSFKMSNRSTEARPRKRLVCYARPEKHAGRNLFEVCVIALRQACLEGVFDHNWEFLGIGALGNSYDIELGPTAMMRVLPKIPQADYEELLLSFDVGLSLMWAPHPSVLPFELARSGVVTVTNEFSNRSRERLDQFGFNIVPVVPTIPEIVNGLREAVKRSMNLDARLEATQFDWPSNWDQVFTSSFINKVLEEVEAIN